MAHSLRTISSSSLHTRSATFVLLFSMTDRHFTETRCLPWKKDNKALRLLPEWHNQMKLDCELWWSLQPPIRLDQGVKNQFPHTHVSLEHFLLELSDVSSSCSRTFSLFPNPYRENSPQRDREKNPQRDFLQFKELWTMLLDLSFRYLHNDFAEVSGTR